MPNWSDWARLAARPSWFASMIPHGAMPFHGTGTKCREFESELGTFALTRSLHFAVPRVSLIVPPILILVPGIYAFEAIVYLNRGSMLDALQAFAICSFVIGALAMGLATARIFSSQ
jgi:hypothetical protein